MLQPLLLLIALQAATVQAAVELFPTVAESSDFRATARYADVVSFCEKLAESSPVVHLGEMGKSFEGRSLPLLILADPPVATPEDAAATDKLVVFVFGNIHAGEVCGKEALLMLAREIATTPDHPLLRDLVIVFAPILNADGNERMAKDNRPGQLGPEQGMGTRANAQGLNINRDFTKLETPEARAMARFLTRWDPAIIIDLHTTNGSLHRYTLTYDAPRNPAGNPSVIEFTRDAMLPEVGRRLEKASGYKTFFYGNFTADHARWETYPALPRFSTHYGGLRNRITILSEAYAYASFKDRVLGTREFVRQCLLYAAENKDEIGKLLLKARRDTIAAGKDPSEIDTVAVRCEPRDFESPVTIQGWVEQGEGRERSATSEPRDYQVTFDGQCDASVSVALPYAYLLPASLVRVAENLQRHGIEVEELREDIELDLEVYRIDALQRDDQPFENHHMVTASTTARIESRRVEAGTLLVRTGQALGSLAAYLLEPGSEDGLCAWNFLDGALEEGGDYPIARLRSPVPLILRPVTALPGDREEGKRITFETIYGDGDRPDFGGSPVSGIRWLEDGEHFLQVKDGIARKVDAATGRSEPFYDRESLAEALRSLPTIDEESARSMSRRRSLHFNEQRDGALFVHENDLYYASLDGAEAVRLTETPAGEELATFSPDGQFVAFHREHDLFVVDIASRSERALTTGGTELISNGKADWVYMEEVYGRGRPKTFWWDPTSTRIAFLQFDDAPVSRFTVIDQIPTRQEVESTAYPKAGDPNPKVRLGVVTAAGGPVRWIDLGSYLEGSFLITRVGWLPGGESIYFYVQDRAQTWLDFNVVPSEGGRPERLFRETTGAWVANPGEAHFLDDGSFLLLSERTGWKHIYRFDEDGSLRAQVTDGAWEVRRIDLVDEDSGLIYFTATRDSHIAHNLYRIELDGTGLERLTVSPGHHRVNLSPKGNYFIDTWSDIKTPRRVRLYRTDGTPSRDLDTNPAGAIEEYRLGVYEQFQIETSDGFALEASLLKPPDFDPDRQYPVWFMTYGGPHAPQIRNDWSGGRVRDQMLAELGFIVFRCDPRSASGKGAESAWTAYRQLGVQEMRDIEEAIAWLSALAYVDAERIGMSGHSYGGFMTVYAMTHSTLFAAGIASAPVTDWRNYDTIYTERYMGIPQDNPEGYERASVVEVAGDLHGRLLILHGVRDDNVHLQNTLQLVKALQEADKDFEMMLYPGSRHGLGGTHYQRLMIDFMTRSLGLANGRGGATN